ncbi:MAG TPA: hypothetical protein VMF51_04840 [Nocardioides sp.]|uniref:hypothetical protein n=1 Tax=Nocardioides sp. TaxID=35761 RepID=UPI002B8AD0AF|nr:hypothetical protein [Nocardioides sp.]HTW14433.1 hypothetical protein [Nocardioides sp.]
MLSRLRIEQLLRSESIDPDESTDAIDPTESTEPSEPTESTEPTLPMDSTDPSEQIERKEFFERQESIGRSFRVGVRCRATRLEGR